jgi:hypothetical protein
MLSHSIHGKSPFWITALVPEQSKSQCHMPTRGRPRRVRDARDRETHDVSHTLIASCTQQCVTGELAGLSAAEIERRQLEGRVALLERKLGQLTLENELLKKTLPRSSAAIRLGIRRAAASITPTEALNTA